MLCHNSRLAINWDLVPLQHRSYKCIGNCIAANAPKNDADVCCVVPPAPNLSEAVIACQVQEVSEQEAQIQGIPHAAASCVSLSGMYRGKI